MKKIKSILSILIIITIFTTPVFAESLKISPPGGAAIEFGNISPYIDNNYRTMFPLAHFNKIFKQGITYSVDNNKIIITKKIFSINDVIVLEINSDILIKNEEQIKMDTVPLRINNNIFIPLRFVANALEYWVNYDERTNMISYDNNIAEIYIWNENKDSSVDGIRYSVLPGTLRKKELSEIKKNPLKDFNEVKNQLSWVAPGEGILTTVLYGVSEYKVPYKKLNEVTETFFDLLGSSGSASTYICLDEIPPIISDLKDYTNDWFSAQLFALGEKNLKEYGEHSYRFTCIPSFTNTYSIRVQINQNGDGVLHYAECKGPISYYGGKLIKNIDKAIDKDIVLDILNNISKSKFWDLPKEIDELGLDGEEWIIEGYKDGKYHIVDRWTPREGNDIYKIGNYFNDLKKSIN